MSSYNYTKYKASRFGTGKPLKKVASMRESNGGQSAVYGSGAVKTFGKLRSFSWAKSLKWLMTLVMIAGIGVIVYAGATVGYGYLQVRVGQEELRSLFSITGNGSVDPDYLQSEAAAMRSGIERFDPVGEINIPGIGCRWMIVEGADDEALKKGPGHIEETMLPGEGGNFAVAGDRVLYGAPFLDLDDVEIGDEISVRMPYGTFRYRVTETFIVTPDDVSVLDSTGDETITLLTCDPPWDIKQRIVVRGELEDVEKPDAG